MIDISEVSVLSVASSTHLSWYYCDSLNEKALKDHFSICSLTNGACRCQLHVILAVSVIVFCCLEQSVLH